MFRSVVRISVQGGSGHCVMLCRVSEPAAYLQHSMLLYITHSIIFFREIKMPSTQPVSVKLTLTGCVDGSLFVLLLYLTQLVDRRKNHFFSDENILMFNEGV